mmetsp:Transcript_66797/g.204493  ORF Transcript_66797/g.204493 Transcript_66797/m.204493 type:complete len:265 (-) Transcript_66797:110-904(-)
MHGARLRKVSQGRLERAERCCLTAERHTDEHDTVPNCVALVKLDDFLDEIWVRLAMLYGEILLQFGRERPEVRRREHNAREQVRRDAPEQGDIEGEELRQVHIADRPEHQDIFALGRVLALEVACGDQDRKHSAHAIIVMLLGRQLLAAQLVCRDNLLRQRTGNAVTVRVELDLGDHRIIGNHHRHGPVQRLEIVGQLGAARVTRVHGDERITRPLDWQCGSSLELEHRQPGLDGVLDLQHLLRNDAQDLRIDAVELIEASPTA